MWDLTGRTLGRYPILDRLGRGGMAEVYTAFQPSLNRYVAIKVLHAFLLDEAGSGERFQREARAVAALHHSNIVPVFDYDHEGGLYFMVMEYIDGPTLKAVLQDHARAGTRRHCNEQGPRPRPGRGQRDGPVADQLPQNPADSTIPQYTSDVTARNFAVAVRFYNPYDRAQNPWDYGIIFRRTQSNDEYRGVVYSKARWALTQGPETARYRPLPALDTSTGGSNLLRLIVQDDQGYFFVNEHYIATLNLAAKTTAGDIAAGTGFTQGDELSGATTRFSDFTVWILP
ncbi:MAG TPA: protein kinase [Chloroflexia bacterium]|nr:protein kinase [Chloroflexia bacterium]